MASTAPNPMISTTATTSTVSSDSDAYKEEVIYKSWDLLIYEIWYLLPQFRANVGQQHHLDIGSGTGYYLRKGNIPRSKNLTLVDLERPALEVGLRRSGRADGNNVRGIVADILQPLPVDDRFDSVSMYYLLHCIPAPVDAKCRIFEHIKRNMTPNGVIHGANVLGRGIRRDNVFAAHVRHGVLKAGIFHNEDDNAYDFEHSSRKNFHEVETSVVGSVFVFRAAKPRFN